MPPVLEPLSGGALIWRALFCKCPKCGEAGLYKPGILPVLRDTCPACGLLLAQNDVGDSAAVFLIFVLGFLLVPLALLFEYLLSPPLWAHGVVWGAVALGLTLVGLRPLKSYVIALQFKHRPEGFLPGAPDASGS